MPTFTIGDQLPVDRTSTFVKLTAKGEKITFRLVGGGSYDGKHFLKSEGKYTVVDCPRAVGETECQYCTRYFDLKKLAKEAEEEGAKKDLTDQANEYKQKLTFYYPIINRATEKAQILKTAFSVRKKIEAMVEAGVNVLTSDLVLIRTEDPGADYYQLIRLDSADTKPLTETEESELAVAKEWDLETMTNGKRSTLEMDDELPVGGSLDTREAPPWEEEE